MNPVPPSILRRLLAWILPPGPVRDGLLGDLDELYADRVRRSRASADLWYARQLFSAAVQYPPRRLWARGTEGKGAGMMEELGSDLGYGFRMLRRRPGFTAAVVLTLALGIGANTALFSVINGVLLQRLPFVEPDRLVRVWPDGSFPAGGIELLRERSSAYEQVAAYGWASPVSLTDHGEPELLTRVAVTPNLFATLGTAAALGRTLLAGEERPGQDPVVVLSHGLWQRRFGRDPAMIGRDITLNGEPRTVVGVMPASFRFPDREAELWVPATFDAARPDRHWGLVNLRVIGRLRPDVTLERARAELDAVMPAFRDAFPWKMPDDWGAGAGVSPLKEAIIGDVRPMLLILLGAVGLLLLISCVNVVNLLLGQAAMRRQEAAVRTALGAGRGRLIRQFLTESVLLAVLAGGGGVLLAFWGVQALISALPAAVPRVDEIGLDVRVLGFAMVITLLTGVLIGLVPALRTVGDESSRGTLRVRGRGSGVGREQHRATAALVVAEVALAVVLVVGAGLLVRSFSRMLQVDPGFRAANLVAATVTPPEFRFQDDASHRAFYQELLRRMETAPGIAAVAVGSGVPFGGIGGGGVFLIEGRPNPRETGDWPISDAHMTVSPEYFVVTGIPLLAGRGFTDTDREGTPSVAIVSRKLAEQYWRGEDPVGKRLKLLDDEEWRTIIGVVGDVQWNQLIAARGTGLYVPFLQRSARVMRVVARSGGDSKVVIAHLGSVVRSIDEQTPVSDVRTMDEFIAASLAEPRFAMLLLALFAAVALLLGAVGVYGVLAHAVSERTREIGIRMALGARAGEVLRLVMRRGLILALTGTGLGIVGALAVTRVLSSLLFGVSTTDPLTYAAVAFVLLLVALTASYVPARRAARVDPMSALRYE